jgi:hypothetical protein
MGWDHMVLEDSGKRFVFRDRTGHTHGGVDTLDDDEDHELVFQMRKKISRSESWIDSQGLTCVRIQ